MYLKFVIGIILLKYKIWLKTTFRLISFLIKLITFIWKEIKVQKKTFIRVEAKIKTVEKTKLYCEMKD